MLKKISVRQPSLKTTVQKDMLWMLFPREAHVCQLQGHRLGVYFHFMREEGMSSAAFLAPAAGLRGGRVGN